MLRKHVRMPDPMVRGHFHHFECKCGWRGKVPVVTKGRRLDVDQLRDAAERAWVEHIPPRERRVYLLLDTRPPPNFRDLDQIKLELRDQARDEQLPIDETRLAIAAQAEFNGQRKIMGNFLMPEGTPVHLVDVTERDDLYFGKFQSRLDGPIEELPIGEVREPNGRVWCAE